MKYIVFYNECLRSKIIYSNFLKKNKKDIRCVIQLPVNINKKNRFFLIKKGILNKNAYSYILYQFTQTILYNIFSFLSFSNIKSICKKYKISHKKLNQFPNKNEIKKIIVNYKKEDIIFISTTYILKHRDLMLENLILNLHEADPTKYKGSAIYFRLANDKAKYIQTAIIEPNLNIDSGRIVLFSDKKLIKNLSVFKIIILGYKMQSNLLEKIKKIKNKKNYPKIKNNLKSTIYSFPSRKLEKEIKNKNIGLINIKDCFFIIHLSMISNINKLYNKINFYLR